MLEVVAIVSGLIFFACWIYTIVVAFTKGSVVLGIVSICPLVAFVLGWVKSNEWDHQKVMLVWSVAWIVGLIYNVITATGAA